MSVAGDKSDVLLWQHKLLSADDLRRHLDGHRSILLAPKTLVTPLAQDELRARNVAVTRAETESPGRACRLALAQESAMPLIQTVIKDLAFGELPLRNGDLLSWLASLVREVTEDRYSALAVFCTDPAHAACLANKHENIRAAAVYAVPHAVRALKSFAANFLAIEMPGRTFFEIRQILTAMTKEAAHAHR